MTYLDVSPMMTALRLSPEDFEIREGWLGHIPSRHEFVFSKEGRVQIRARCDCSMLSIRPEQEAALATSYNEWQRTYWRPLLINREFASHFKRSATRQMLINFAAWIHRKLQEGHQHHGARRVSAIAPAE